MYRDPPVASLMRRIGLSFTLGFALFGLGALVNAFLERRHVGGLSLYVDDVILGLIAGLLVFFYEQRRYQATLNKIRVIAEMNHHVRNALQAIALSPYAEKSQQIQLIDESAQRIQWALREILPGEVEAPPAPDEKTIAN
jgi:hypothetical protein